jgi:hypothetical protein
LVHGVVDAPRLYFCLESGDSLHGPYPESGLEFGETVVLSDNDAEELRGEENELLAIAPLSSDAAERSCSGLLSEVQLAEESLDASSPDAGIREVPRAATVVSLGAATLAEDRSYLLVAAGCLSQQGRTGDELLAVCGPNYRPNQASLRPSLGLLSRIKSSSAVALQLLPASAASPAINVRSVPGNIGNGVVTALVSDARFGELRPAPPLRTLTVETLGQPLWTVQLEVTAETFDIAESGAWETLWEIARVKGDLPALENGRGYTLVLVGPRPWIEGSGFWQDATFTLVDNDPLE